MDLKTVYTSLSSDIGQFDGTVLELVVFLRKRAISDMIRMSETQLVYVNEFYENASATYTTDQFISGKEEHMEMDVEEQIALADSTDLNVPQTFANILDTQLNVKLQKFVNVIAFFDNIIALDGVVTSGTSQDMVNKFKELDGVYSSYGTFTLSDSYRTV